MHDLITLYRSIHKIAQAHSSPESASPEILTALCAALATDRVKLCLLQDSALQCIASTTPARTNKVPREDRSNSAVSALDLDAPRATPLPGGEVEFFVPLRWDGAAIGVFSAVYKPGAPTPAVETLGIAGDMVAHCVAGLLVREDRQITERLTAAQLEELAILFDRSPIGIAIALDPKCETIRVNPAAGRMLGIKSREYFSKSSKFGGQLRFRVLDQGEEVAPHDLPIQRAARDGVEISDLNLDIEHADGRVINLFEYASPLRDENGALRGAVGFLVDVTPLHQAQRELKDRLEDLAQLSEGKNHLLAVIAHELRNPLSAIWSAGQILNRPNMTQHHRWAFEGLERQVRLMSRLIEDLLDASRLGRNQLRLQLQPLDLKDVVKNAIEAAAAPIGEKHQKLAVSVPEEPVLVSGDPTRLEQILRNLLVNSSKYSDSGTDISITVTMRKGSAVVSVKDNGIGIEPAFLPKVFERFMQVLPDSKRSRDGLGLGLTLVKSLTEMHGGTVRAESDGPGHGSEFTVSFPLLDSRRADLPEKSEKSLRLTVVGGKGSV